MVELQVVGGRRSASAGRQTLAYGQRNLPGNAVGLALDPIIAHDEVGAATGPGVAREHGLACADDVHGTAGALEDDRHLMNAGTDLGIVDQTLVGVHHDLERQILGSRWWVSEAGANREGEGQNGSDPHIFSMSRPAPPNGRGVGVSHPTTLCKNVVGRLEWNSRFR